MKRSDAGNLVFDALIDNPGGLSSWDLVELTDLTQAQIRYAFGYIREVLASDQGEPIIYDPSTRLYKLAPVPVEAATYAAYRLRVAIVQLRRLRTGTIEPALAKFGKGMEGVVIAVALLERSLQYAYTEATLASDGRLGSTT